MQAEINDMSGLASLSSQLGVIAQQFEDSTSRFNSIIRSAKNYDGIDVVTPGKILRNNLKTASLDLKNISQNVAGYIQGINTLDKDDISDQVNHLSLDYITGEIGDFLSNSLQNFVINPINNIAASIGTAASVLIGSITAPFTTEEKVEVVEPEQPQNSVAIPASEYVNTDPNTQQTGDVSREITQSISYVPPSARYPENGQISSSDRIVISPGDSNANLDLSVYHNNTESGFQVTTGNLQYELSKKDYETICAIVAAESDRTYDDALAVATTIFNRCETSNWVNAYSRDPIQQISAPGQFAVYSSGSYKNWLGGNVPVQVSKAVSDVMSGVRNHDYCFFRSNSSTRYSDNMITPTGNRYGYK